MCDIIPLPYFEQFEVSQLDGSPPCSIATSNSFISFKTFEISPGPVEGFSGRVAQYDLATDLNETLEPDGEYGIESSLYLGYFLLEENKSYTLSYNYGQSSSYPVQFRAILTEPQWDGYSFLITNMQEMPDENGIIVQTIGVPYTAIYQLHFNAIVNTNDGFVYLDDVRLEESITAGTDSHSVNNLKIYPNPVKDIITIANSEVINTVELYNSIGQLVLSSAPNATQFTLNINHVPAGVYFATVKSGKQTKSTRIIKE